LMVADVVLVSVTHGAQYWVDVSAIAGIIQNKQNSISTGNILQSFSVIFTSHVMNRFRLQKSLV